MNDLYDANVFFHSSEGFHLQEITRRSSDVSNVSAFRRGSVHRGSITEDDTEELEKKKMKAVLQLMGFQKKAQKDYRWDTVTKPEPEPTRR